MIEKIIRFSVYHRGLVLSLTALLAYAGWKSFESLPIDAVPDITNVQVQINTTSGGMAPEEAERTITFPIETAMSGIPNVTNVRSITRFGLSQVTVIFEEHVNIYKARQLVAERLQMVAGQLAEDVHPQLGPPSTGLGEIYFYTVEAEQIEKEPAARVRQLMELRALQEWFVEPRLLTVQGVAGVNTTGGYEKQIHINPDPKLLTRYGIHFNDIEQALEKTNKNIGGGVIQQTGEQIIVQGMGIFKSVDDILNVPVKTLGTTKTLMLRDIATVGLGKELRTGAALVGGREAVLGNVMMVAGENSRAVSLRVAERIEEIRKSLPPGYWIETVYNRSDLVNATLKTVKHNLSMGAALVVLILFLFMGSIRAAIVAALTIPLALLSTFIVMKQLGISGNLMSLGALDFGIIIDGTIIIIDNCVRVIQNRIELFNRPLEKEELKNAIFGATSDIRKSAGFGELIILVVFLPIFALTGIEGKMFIPMVATFCIAVLSALLLSFTSVPALATVLLIGRTRSRESWIMERIKERYVPFLSWSVRWRKSTLLIGVAGLCGGFYLITRLGGEFLPQLDEVAIAIQFVRPTDISLDASIALQEKSEGILSEFPEVSGVFSRIGTSEVATDPMGVNLADTYVMLKPRDAWPLDHGARRTKEELIDEMVDRLEAELPGQRPLVSQPIQMRFNELLEGTRSDVSVKVFGDDMDTLRKLTDGVAGVIRKVQGAGDVEVDLPGASPILRVIPREGILPDLGVSNGEVMETVEFALGGHEVGSFYEGIKRFPIIVRVGAKEIVDLEAIRSLPVGIAASAMIPLADAAAVRFERAYSQISREQIKRRAAVMINPRGRDTESFINEAQKKVEAEIRMPPGYYMEWGGNFKNLQNARKHLLLLMPVALCIGLMMIYAAFQKFSETLIISFCVPLGLVGGVAALIFRGMPFSISAGVGFIALLGIAVLDGLVLIHQFHYLERADYSVEALATLGSVTRLRAVLMTALVDIFGFLPMMLSTGVGAEVQKPLATVVIGGVISSTILTLVILPSAYALFVKQDTGTSPTTPTVP